MNINIKKIVSGFLILSILIIPEVSFASHRNYSSLDRKIDKLDSDSVEEMAIPILLGVAVNNLIDSHGDLRSGGRSHEGIDIFAPRGTLIVSPTEAVVTRIDDKGLGGVQVWTANPGKESFYYAHLHGVWPLLEVGDELEIGDPIGFVGNTGNASFASPHLHLGMYDEDRNSINPYNRLTETFEVETIIDVLTLYVKYLIEQLEKENG